MNNGYFKVYWQNVGSIQWCDTTAKLWRAAYEGVLTIQYKDISNSPCVKNTIPGTSTDQLHIYSHQKPSGSYVEKFLKCIY
jgi:hypothetical protein